MEYFPPDVFAGRPDLHPSQGKNFACWLRWMGERPLYPPEPDVPTVYRLLALPSFGRPSVVRLTETGDTWCATCKVADAEVGRFGMLAGEAERELSRAEAEVFACMVARSGFWDLPAAGGGRGLDGATLVLEGAGTGRYHLVARWSAESEQFDSLLRFMFGLGRRVGDPPPQPPPPPKYVRSFGDLVARFQLQGEGTQAEPGAAADGPRL